MLTAQRRLKALWLDGWDEKEPFIGACCGSPALIMAEASFDNAAADIGKNVTASWSKVAWSTIVTWQPDVIILVDAVWDTASSKVGPSWLLGSNYICLK